MEVWTSLNGDLDLTGDLFIITMLCLMGEALSTTTRGGECTLIIGKGIGGGIGLNLTGE